MILRLRRFQERRHTWTARSGILPPLPDQRRGSNTLKQMETRRLFWQTKEEEHRLGGRKAGTDGRRDADEDEEEERRPGAASAGTDGSGSGSGAPTEPCKPRPLG